MPAVTRRVAGTVADVSHIIVRAVTQVARGVIRTVTGTGEAQSRGRHARRALTHRVVRTVTEVPRRVVRTVTEAPRRGQGITGIKSD